MATSEQKIRVYVSKVESSVSEYVIVKSNFDKKYDYNRSECSMLTITGLSDDEIIERIKNHMILFFRGIMSNLNESGVKFDVDYFFNREYSAKGQLLYHHGNNGHDKSHRYFHRMYWVDLIKPLTDKEIELFIKALRKIPFLKE
jgi:hypothetical protein